MYTFACRDLGTDCGFQATGATVEEVKQKALAHAQITHREELAKLPPEQLANIDQTLTAIVKQA
jgi:predicted small metal-binding protein